MNQCDDSFPLFFRYSMRCMSLRARRRHRAHGACGPGQARLSEQFCPPKDLLAGPFLYARNAVRCPVDGLIELIRCCPIRRCTKLVSSQRGCLSWCAQAARPLFTGNPVRQDPIPLRAARNRSEDQSSDGKCLRRGSLLKSQGSAYGRRADHG
jgi:hypothetical protein